MARLYTILKFMTVVLVYSNLVRCSQPDPTAPRDVRVSPLPVSSTVELELRTMTDFSSLIENPNCSLPSALAWWSGTGKDWASIYLGESKIPSDSLLPDSQFQILVSLMDAVRPHAAMLTSGILSLGVGNWQKASKTSRTNWLFDYNAPGLPWNSKVDLKFTKKLSGEKSTIRIATRTEGFRADLPLFLDFPNRRNPTMLQLNRAPEDQAIKSVIVAHANEREFSKLGVVSKNHWGIVVTDAKTIDDLESRNWVPLSPAVPLTRILLYSGGGLRIEPMRCESLPVAAPRAEIARVVETINRLRGGKKGFELLGILSDPIEWSNPEETSEKPSVGHWLADVLRNAAHADFAFVPSYGVNKGPLDKGELTRRTLARSFPINEKLYLLDMSGAEITMAMNAHLDIWIRDGQFPFFYSGRRIELTRGETAENRVRVPVKKDEFYKVVTYESVLKTKSPSKAFTLPGVATPLRFDVHQGIEIYLRKTKGTSSKSKLGVSPLKVR